MKLTSIDKLVLKNVTKRKCNRNTIRNGIFNKHLDKSLFPRFYFPSKSRIDYVLKKLVSKKLIKTEKWEQRNMRVYFK